MAQTTLPAPTPAPFSAEAHPDVAHLELYDGGRYVGTLQALQRAGLVPAEIEAHATRDKRGAQRWRDRSGSRWVLSARQDHAGRHVLTRHLSTSARAVGRAAREQEQQTRDRVDVIDRALRWTDAEGQMRYCLTRCVEDGFRQAEEFAWRSSRARGPWTLRDDQRRQFDEIRRQCYALLAGLEAQFDPTWRTRLEDERALLGASADDVESTSAAAAVLGRFFC